MEGVGAPYSAKAFANLVLDWAEDQSVPVTPLKLQKMLFFVHADYLCKYGSALINEEFEAWNYGPVVPSVYAQFKEFSRQPITKRAVTFDPISRTSSIKVAQLDGLTSGRVREIFDIYIGVEGGVLSGLSHRSDGPWDQARKQFEANKNINRVISNNLIAAAHNSAAS